MLRELSEELQRLDGRMTRFDVELSLPAREMRACQRLISIPGVGVLTATALASAAGDASAFRRPGPRAAALPLGTAAWVGL